MMANLSEQEREDRREAMRYANTRSAVMSVEEVLQAAEEYLKFLQGDTKPAEKPDAR